MAATATRGFSFDPARKGQYPVILSERLLAESTEHDFNLASISLNPPSKATKKTIRPLPDASRFDLTIISIVTSSSQSSVTEYTGTQQTPDEATESCVLVFSPSKQSFVLDRLDSNLLFQRKDRIPNGTTGASPLQIGEEVDGSDDGLFGDEEKDDEDLAEADATNPYDYRHFIQSAPQSSAGSQASSRQQSPALKPSPHVKASTTFKPSPLNGAHTPVQQLPRAKAKPKAKPIAPRVVSPEESTAPAPSPFGNHSSDADDDDVLTIELDDGPPKRKNRFQNVFRNLQGEGPISMRSAASSVSPGILGHGGEEEDDGDEEVLEFEDAEEEESDEDVEEREQFQLPSPVIGRGREQEEEEESDVDEEPPRKESRVNGQQNVDNEEAEDEEEDEFEAAIARGFEEQQEGGVGLGVDLGPRVGQVAGLKYESSSESEAD